MSYYVMSDIHGCYDEMIRMLEQVKFSHSDTLIIAGDYIDRGSKSFEMLKWIEYCPDNVILLRGNHDEEFASNIDLMDSYRKKICFSEDSEDETKLLYETIRCISAQKSKSISFFDYYGTVQKLINYHGVTLAV